MGIAPFLLPPAPLSVALPHFFADVAHAYGQTDASKIALAASAQEGAVCTLAGFTFLMPKQQLSAAERALLGVAEERDAVQIPKPACRRACCRRRFAPYSIKSKTRYHLSGGTE